MKKLVLGSVAFVALTAASAANAACLVNDVVRANNQVSLDFTETAFWYGPENINPVPPGFAPNPPGGLDGETSYLPGLQATGSAMVDIGSVCNLYISGSFSYMAGNTSYFQNGGTSLINRATVEDWDFRFGKGFNLGLNGMITPYVGLGTNWWNRTLTGAGGYNEIYKHDYAGVGALLQYSPGPGWVLALNGLVGGSFNASQTSSLIPGVATAVCVCTYPLGGALTYMAGGSVDYAITANLHANAGVEFTYFTYGQSPVITPGPGNPGFPLSWLEPNSNTSYFTAFIGIGYHWGPAAVSPVFAK